METLLTISNLFRNKYWPKILSYYNKQTNNIKNAMYKSCYIAYGIPEV